MPEPLEYAQPRQEPIKHSELGSLSLAFTGIWVACLAMTATAMVVERGYPPEHLTLVLAMLTLMAMVIFVPIGFLVAVLGLTEQHCRRGHAYACASINGCVLMIVFFAVMWDRL